MAPAPAVKLLETPPAFNSVVTESATKAREAEATANEAAVKKLIWERLGLKSSGMVFRDQIPKEYRGGMMIEEVDEQRSAFAAGIRKGDILVGLDKWETTSLDNVVFILNHTDTQPKPPSSVVQIKAFLVRGGNTMDTTIEVSGRSPLKPKSEGAGF